MSKYKIGKIIQKNGKIQVGDRIYQNVKSDTLKDEPATILILAANPKGTVPLRLDEEVREISEALRLSEGREKFKLELRLAVRIRDIQPGFFDTQPQIVHFCGHGQGKHAELGGGDFQAVTHRKLVAPGAEREGLFFEDDSGQTALVSSAALVGLFKAFSKQVECVVFNACYSIEQAKAVAEAVPKGINFVGMSQAISDQAAIAFVRGFYSAIGNGASYEEAYHHGCAEIGLGGIPEALIPIFIKKSD